MPSPVHNFFFVRTFFNGRQLEGSLVVKGKSIGFYEGNIAPVTLLLRTQHCESIHSTKAFPSTNHFLTFHSLKLDIFCE